jgi:hypothetical protein
VVERYGIVPGTLSIEDNDEASFGVRVRPNFRPSSHAHALRGEMYAQKRGEGILPEDLETGPSLNLKRVLWLNRRFH